MPGGVLTTMALGDLDMDGRLDLAVADAEGQQIHVLPMPSLRGEAVPVGGNPVALEVLDVDGDRALDLLVLLDDVERLQVLRGLGEGAFEAGQEVSAGPSPGAMVLVDADGDGDRDVLIASSSQAQMTLLRAGPGGTLAVDGQLVLQGVAQHLVAVDLEGDGRAEVVAAVADPPGLALLRRGAEGDFEQPRVAELPSAPGSLAVGDLDGDGLAEVVAALPQEAELYAGRATPQGAWQVIPTASVRQGAELAGVADFDGDGYADLAVGYPLLGELFLLTGPEHATPIPALDPPLPVAVGLLSPRVAELTGDGRADLVTLTADGMVMMLQGDGGEVASVAADLPATRPHQARLIHFDDDGLPDLFLLEDRGASHLYRSTGDGGLERAGGVEVGRGHLQSEIGDFNGDGRPDIIVSHAGDNELRPFLASGAPGDFVAAEPTQIGPRPGRMALADLNGDGTTDLAVCVRDSSQVAALLGNGDGTFREVDRFETSWWPSGVEPEDINGDGHVDLVVVSEGARRLWVAFGLGDGSFEPPPVDGRQLRVGLCDMALGDVDLDGLTDLLLADSEGSNVSVLLGQGHGVFGAELNYRTSSAPWTLAAGDIDGDGLLDVASSSWNTESVSVLLGRGDGSLASRVDMPASWQTFETEVADWDQDGFADVVATDLDLSAWRVYRANAERQAFAALAPGRTIRDDSELRCAPLEMGAMALLELGVRLRLDHPRRQDLRLVLRAPGVRTMDGSPAPVQVELKPAGCPCPAAVLLPSAGDPCLAAELAPAITSVAAGTWELCVADTAPQPDETGELVSWELVGRAPIGRPPTAPTALAPAPGLLLRTYADPAFEELRQARASGGIFEDHPEEPPQVLQGHQGGYSMRWTGWMRARLPGHYTLRVEAHGGVRVMVNGETVVDALQAEAPGTYDNSADPLWLAAGWHPIDVRYVSPDAAGGRIRLRLAAPHRPPGPLLAAELGH